MEPADFGRHRKALIGTSAISFVFAASQSQKMSLAGVDLSGTWVWVFLGIAHIYFMLMFWTCFGLGRQSGQDIGAKVDYTSDNKKFFGDTFTYNIPFALGIFGAANIVLHLLMILVEWMTSCVN